MGSVIWGKKPEIIYEDNHIIVVEKPPNLLTQGDRTGDDNLLDILKEDKERYNKPGNVYLGLVHRHRPWAGSWFSRKRQKPIQAFRANTREKIRQIIYSRRTWQARSFRDAGALPCQGREGEYCHDVADTQGCAEPAVIRAMPKRRPLITW